MESFFVPQYSDALIAEITGYYRERRGVILSREEAQRIWIPSPICGDASKGRWARGLLSFLQGREEEFPPPPAAETPPNPLLSLDNSHIE